MPDAKEVLEYLEKGNVFKQGVKVISDHFGEGIVNEVFTDGRDFPITCTFVCNACNAYTPEGYGKKLNDTIHLLFMQRNFKVGDRIIACDGRKGTVLSINEDAVFPIVVQFDVNIGSPFVESYTEKGKVFDNGKPWGENPSDISIFEDNVGNVNNTVADPINPAHYKAEGIPEAIEIMRGLMTDEQIEGFLWGNIIKYAYRYGRKGDKKETAEKIKWYAEKLAETKKEDK